jgi:hypothetical protein
LTLVVSIDRIESEQEQWSIRRRAGRIDRMEEKIETCFWALLRSGEPQHLLCLMPSGVEPIVGVDATEYSDELPEDTTWTIVEVFEPTTMAWALIEGLERMTGPFNAGENGPMDYLLAVIVKVFAAGQRSRDAEEFKLD